MQLSAANPALLQVAIGVRSVSRGYIPDKAFIIVSLAVTAFMLIGWRTGLAALTKVCSAILFNKMSTTCIAVQDSSNGHGSCSGSFGHAAMITKVSFKSL